MNWEEHIFHWGNWNEPIGNSAHKFLSKYIFLAYVYKSIALVNELTRLKC